MKLWQKIFLCALLLMTAAIDLTALFLVRSSHALLLEREQTRSAAEQESLAVSIANLVAYQRLVQGHVLLDEDVVVQLIDDSLQTAQVAGAAVWRMAAGTLAEETPLAQREAGLILHTADKAALLQGGCTLRPVEWEGRQYLLVGSTLMLDGREYALFTTADITIVYEAKAEQLAFIRRMSLLCSVVFALVLLVLVRRLLRPLRRMNAVTRTIAGGRYTVRVPEKGSVELRQLAQSMNGMAASVEQNVRRLQRVADERQVFIANLSHEMKTPLTSILGFADLLRISRDLPEKRRREYAQIIVEETNRLKTLSGKLMELITVGSTELQWESIHLENLLSEIGATLQPTLDRQSIRLTVRGEPTTFCGDVALLKSLLYNLLDNAVKASAPGGEVHLRGEAAGPFVRLTVRDEGAGMSPEAVARATEPFYMEDKSRSRKAGGAGLGLALCAAIVRAHGGRLVIDSVRGLGTTVTVTLPREREEESA